MAWSLYLVDLWVNARCGLFTLEMIPEWREASETKFTLAAHKLSPEVPIKSTKIRKCSLFLINSRDWKFIFHFSTRGVELRYSGALFLCSIMAYYFTNSYLLCVCSLTQSKFYLSSLAGKWGEKITSNPTKCQNCLKILVFKGGIIPISLGRLRILREDI